MYMQQCLPKTIEYKQYNNMLQTIKQAIQQSIAIVCLFVNLFLFANMSFKSYVRILPPKYWRPQFLFNQFSLSLKTMYLCSANVNATMVTYEWLINIFGMFKELLFLASKQTIQ